MISYAAEDNEDTERMLEKTYRDALIPLQEDLLNTKIVEPTITLIPKQEIDSETRNCTHNPQRSSRKMTHSPTSLS
jgi:hypothetical protein